MGRSVKKVARKKTVRKQTRKKTRKGNGLDLVPIEASKRVVGTERREGFSDPLVRMTADELKLINAATAVVELSKTNLQAAWGPIRARYNLPPEIAYDRVTGDIMIRG